MRKLKEVYKRTFSAGDYFLYCLVDWNFYGVVVGKIETDENPYIKFEGDYLNILDSIILDKYRTIRTIVNVYKLTGDIGLFEKYYKIGLSRGRLYIEHTSEDSAKDIFGRNLAIGDFVMFKRNLRPFTLKGTCYGILIDKDHVLSVDNIKEKCNMVYKLEKGMWIKEEERSYQQISTLYNASLQNKLSHKQKVSNAVRIGDIYRKNNNAYMFLGVYDIFAYENQNLIGKKGVGRYNRVCLYLYMNLKRKRDKKLFTELLSGDSSHIDEFISSSGNSNWWPDCFYFTPSLPGEYIGHLDYEKKEYYHWEDTNRTVVSFDYKSV